MTERAYQACAVLGLAMAGGLADPAVAQTLGAAADVSVPWWRVLGALVICIGLALAAILALRTRLKGGAPFPFTSGKWWLPEGLKTLQPHRRDLRLVETVRLSHQIDVCVLRWRDQELVVAATAQGATLLAQAPAPPLSEDAE